MITKFPEIVFYTLTKYIYSISESEGSTLYVGLSGIVRNLTKVYGIRPHLLKYWNTLTASIEVAIF